MKTGDKKSQIHSDLEGMEINHLLRPWSTCKVLLEISYAEFVSSVCHEHYDHPNNLQIESDAFCASGLVMGFLLWGERSGKQDLRVVVGWNFVFQVFVR